MANSCFFLPDSDEACSLEASQQFSLTLILKCIIKTIWGLLVRCQEADTTAAVKSLSAWDFAEAWSSNALRSVGRALEEPRKAGLGRGVCWWGSPAKQPLECSHQQTYLGLLALHSLLLPAIDLLCERPVVGRMGIWGEKGGRDKREGQKKGGRIKIKVTECSPLCSTKFVLHRLAQPDNFCAVAILVSASLDCGAAKGPSLC